LSLSFRYTWGGSLDMRADAGSGMTSLEGVWRAAVTPAELETLRLLSSRG
jgi:hypothetical protein